MRPESLSTRAVACRWLATSLVSIAAAAGGSRLVGQEDCNQPNLLEFVLGADDSGTQLNVIYTDAPASPDFLDPAWALESRDALVTGSNTLLDYTFPQAFSTAFPAVESKFVDFSNDRVSGRALQECILIDSPMANIEHGVGLGLEQTLHHELFHMVQRRYMSELPPGEGLTDTTSPNRLGTWASEAQAALVPERMSLVADWFLSSQFRGWVTYYLETRTAVPLFELSYEAALFWSYACEQLGSSLGNPLQGVDLVRSFWETVVERDAVDAAGALESLLADQNRGSLADFFHDFAIACYVHTRSTPAQGFPNPERYRFLDEQDLAVEVPSAFNASQVPAVFYEAAARQCYCVSGGGCTSDVAPPGPCPAAVPPWHGGPSLEARQACLEGEDEATADCATCVQNAANLVACNACTAWQADCAQGELFFVRALAAEHIDFNLSNVGEKPCTALDLRARSCEPVYWSLVTVDRAGVPRRLWSERGRVLARTILGVAEQDLGRLGLVVTGDTGDTPFEVWLDEVELEVAIRMPTSAQPARPGPGGEAGAFLMRVTVGGPLPVPPAESCPGSSSAAAGGLRREDFHVALVDASGSRVETKLTAAVFLGGEYVLTVSTPAILDNGSYDIELRVAGGLCPTATAVVSGGARVGATVVNHALALDASSSMNEPAENPRLPAVQSAARLYIDGVGARDRVALVTFRGDGDDCEDNSNTVLPLSEATPDLRQEVDADIDGIAASGSTSIGDGVVRARDMLAAVRGRDQTLELVLLSDGAENEGRFLFHPAICDDASVLDPAAEASFWSGLGIAANVIAFGPDAAQGALNQLSAQGAEPRLPWYVDVGAGGGGGGTLSDGLELPSRAADAFLRCLERATRRERLAFTARKVLAGRPAELVLDIDVAAGAREAMFFFHWDEPAAVTVKLQTPQRRELEARAADRHRSATHEVIILQPGSPLTPGRWTAEISAPQDVGVIAGCVARDPEILTVTLDAAPGPETSPDPSGPGYFQQGLPVTLLATITDARGPVGGAEVTVTVETPAGRALGGLCDGLRLADDGAHNDGQPNDGVYGLVFRETTAASDAGASNDRAGDSIGSGQRGTYLVAGTAVGTSNAGTPFARSIECHFHVRSTSTDSDGDGMLDSWERHHGTDPQARDANDDPDADGLFNINEHRNGTDPLNPDTDGSGELDSSEMRRGRCPIDPRDDAVSRPLDVQVVAGDHDAGPALLRDDAVLLRCHATPGQESLRIFRGTGVNPASFGLLANLTGAAMHNGFHQDATAVPGTLYAYRFQAVGAGGAESAPSRAVHGRIPGQPGPSFNFVLDNGATLTGDVEVLATVHGAREAKWYRASGRPLTGRERVEELTTRPITIRLEAPGAPPAAARVYMQVYDARGRASGIVIRSIAYDPAGDLDGDGSPNGRDLDDDQDGLEDAHELARAGTDPSRSDTDGDGDLDGVDPDPLDPGVRGEGAARFLRGDANSDARFDLSDAVTILGFLFLGTSAPECAKSADSDDSGRIDITDAVYILEHLFGGGRPPPLPGARCGVDPTADGLACESHRACR